MGRRVGDSGRGGRLIIGRAAGDHPDDEGESKGGGSGVLGHDSLFFLVVRTLHF